MKLVWVLCFCLVGKLYAAAPEESRAAAESSLGSRYMMAFPMNDEDQLAQESAEAAVKTLAEAIVGSSESSEDDQDDAKSASEQVKEPVLILDVEEKKEGDDKEGEVTIENVEPMGILEAQLEAEDGTQKPPRRSLFKRPKIEELRKILGFPSADSTAQKPKAIPPEKPKAFQNMFKPKQKMDASPNGLQISLPLRREDRMRPFGFPMLPLQRNEGIIRPFGFPDLVQAASNIIRRAIIDDIEAQDINKDDKDDDEEDETNEDQGSNDEEDDDDDDEPLMIVPIPDGKDDPIPRPPLFRRFPIPLPFPVPRPMPVARPRLPMPPITPVAFFLPLAQQLMQNIITRPPPPPPTPRSQPPPLLPVAPIHQIFPFHQPIQNIIPIVPIQQHNMVPMQQPFVHVQQPYHQMMHTQLVPQQAVHGPILIPLASNAPRPMVRPMGRRMPVPQPHPGMGRRMPMPNHMPRMPMASHQPHPMHHAGAQFVNHMPRRPMPEPPTRPLPRMVRPPFPPVHPVLLMMSPVPTMMPQQQQHIPVFHRPQHLPVMQQHVPIYPRHMPVQLQVPQEEERIILVRADPEDQDDDQEVLVLVPTEEVEVAQRPPVLLPQQVMRPAPSPVASPLQRIRLLKELLMARQANRQQAQMQPMPPQGRMPRIVEIVQQQLRIIPAHHQRGQQPMQAHPSRADASELHPVYVPYPGPQ